MATVLTSGAVLSKSLASEAKDYRSREAVVVLAGSGAERAIEVGEVIGLRTATTGTVEADAGNTGDGVAGAVTLGAMAEPGVYYLECYDANADAGTFRVYSPHGGTLPDLTVGVAYDTQHLALTIADGAADFIVGDVFRITVSGDGKAVALDFTATDGSQKAAGILTETTTAADGTDADPVAAIVREALFVDGGLVWPTGITAAQLAQATRELNARLIYIREEG